MRLTRYFNRGERSSRGFSLTELMIAVALTGFIIVILYNVFSQTTKALRSSLRQVDLQDLGAPALTLLESELEGATAFSPTDPFGVNLHIQLGPVKPLVQSSTNGIARTNIIQDLFFLRRDKQQWNATLYRLTDFDITNQQPNIPTQIGTLTRFTTNFHARLLVEGNQMASNFFRTLPSGTDLEDVWPRGHVSKVAERVAHFKVTAFDAAGRPYSYVAPTNYASGLNGDARYYWADAPGTGQSNVVVRETRPLGGDLRVDNVTFYGRAMPAYLEIEVGIIEPVVFDQYRLVVQDTPALAEKFLGDRAHSVHVFRKRIPIASGLRDERLVFSN